MKQLPILLALFAMSAIGFYACEKNDVTQSDTELKSNVLPYEKFNGNMLTALQNDADLDDSKVNTILFVIGKAFKDVIKDPVFITEIMDKVRKNGDSGLSLLDYAKENQAFSDKINERLEILLAQKEVKTLIDTYNVQSSELSSRTFDALAFLSKHLKYKDKVAKEDIIYDPVVYTIKDLPNSTVTPMVAIGATLKGYIEKVPMWDAKDNEYVLGEKEAKAATVPILFIGNGEKNDGKVKSLIETNTNVINQEVEKTVQSRTPNFITLQSFVLNPNFLFEGGAGDGPPDVNWMFRSFDNTGGIQNTPWDSSFGISATEFPNPSNPVSVITFSGGFDTPTNARNIFMCFYEYDWYVLSKKVTGSCTTASGDMKARMKYANEVFVKHCGSIDPISIGQQCSPLFPLSGFGATGTACGVTINQLGTFTLFKS